MEERYRNLVYTDNVDRKIRQNINNLFNGENSLQNLNKLNKDLNNFINKNIPINTDTDNLIFVIYYIEKNRNTQPLLDMFSINYQKGLQKLEKSKDENTEYKINTLHLFSFKTPILYENS